VFLDKVLGVWNESRYLSGMIQFCDCLSTCYRTTLCAHARHRRWSVFVTVVLARANRRHFLDPCTCNHMSSSILESG
jgi:hypothetical protein